ncbi:hypothetical protein [Actinomadura sp. 7K534]|uniref:hypothetical protein n=1 Tax=Actinomadura sp. 7K534 TaxID=2530366 RepID=UPI00104BA87D|nr:hypothetical protein [Actinomadura sp. 7K534]TDB97073.1 hypothetical protein E1266_07915 [Actinomadura sp. 7K534]
MRRSERVCIVNRLEKWKVCLVAVAAVMFGASGLAAPAAADAAPAPCGPWLQALEPPSEKVHSGGEAQGVVKVICPSPIPLAVTLTSADTSWVSVPDKVIVPPGATEATFPIRTHQPDYIYGDLTVSLTAKLRGRTLTQPVILQPGLKFVDFGGRSSIVSGDDVSIFVGLNGPAPEGGMQIPLESDNPALQIPASITIPHGASAIGPRAGSTRIPENADVAVTAKLPGQSLSAVLTLLAWNYDPGEWSFTGAAETYGAYYDMTLNLPNPVPHGGIEVTFTTDHPKIPSPSSPRQYSEGFSGTSQIQVSIPSDIDGDVTITANIEGVGTRSHTVRVHPNLLGFDIEPWLVAGGQPFEGTVRLGTATSVPVTIQLASSDPVVQVPAELTIPAGQSSATFQGTTSPVDGFTFATITARHPSGRTQEKDLYLDSTA